MKLCWILAIAGAVAPLLAACTERNPRYCGDGVCTDPAYPFCDTTGIFGDLQYQCVAVDCVAGELAACRGDDELRCNGSGSNYDVTRCELGCDPNGGCRLCEPGQTACTNGTVATCDASGTVVASEPCPLGCFEDEPRCRELVPSNGLGEYLAMAAAGPDLVLSDAVLEMPAGRVVSASSQYLLDSIAIPPPADGVSIRVFPARSLTVTGTLDIHSSSSAPIGVPAVAFLVDGEVRVDGIIRLTGSTADGSYVAAPPGAIPSGPCVGKPGVWNLVGQPGWSAGGGGGGGATQGGAGGGNWKWSASAGGAAFLNPDLQPLRGGCQGGTPTGMHPTHGGGAIQITSRVAIHLGPNSAIYANGDPGFTTPTHSGDIPGVERMPKGGGSGGGILLEAPEIELASGGVVSANGGAGASGDGYAGSSTEGVLPSLGGACLHDLSFCSSGGDGGSSTGPARTAASIPTQNLDEVLTGAGGGAAGYIRINTREGTYTKANDVIESPVPTTSPLVTQ